MVAFPEIPSPENYGWNLVDGIFIPVMTHLPPAPDAITQLVKCGCGRTLCSSHQCKCKKNGLFCTEFCPCCEGEELCDNAPSNPEVDSDNEENSDDDDDDDV